MNTSKRILKVILVFILITLLAGCGPEKTHREPDYWPTYGWRTTTPEEQGMDSEMLAKMVEHIMKQNYDIHSVTVIRNGYMVADVIFYPYEANTIHQLWSCTKSITSTLIGIAIDQGYIDDVQQPVLSFFSEGSADNLDQDKESMTLEHLLTMSSGLDCEDNQMMETDDWVQHVLDQPMVEPPGTRFEYCNGDPLLLSAIIQKTTGTTVLDYAKEHLFFPLGISNVFWTSSPQGINPGFNGLLMKPHDMAKIGYLFLNEGRWDGEQIVSADWVARSIHEQISGDFKGSLARYGYLWWVRDDGVYNAAGYAGQFIYVVPNYDLVVVFTSNLSDPEQDTPVPLLDDFIIAAVQSSTPLPPNPESVELLNSTIQQASQPEPKPVPPLPVIAKRVSGQTYTMDPNPVSIESITLTFPGEAEAMLNVVAIDGYPQEFRIEENYHVGLDDIYRFLPGDHGTRMGLKGWWESDESFVILFDYIGEARRDLVRFTFKGDQISMEPVGAPIIMNGWLEE